MSSVGTTEIVISLALAVLLVWRQVIPRPLTARSLAVLPVVLVVAGAIALTRVAPLSSTDVRWVALDMAVAVVTGLARGTAMRLSARDGVLWRSGGAVTVMLWIVSIAARLVVSKLGDHAGAAHALGHVLLATFGVSLAGQYVVLALRARRSGIPFAASRARVSR